MAQPYWAKTGSIMPEQKDPSAYEGVGVYAPKIPTRAESNYVPPDSNPVIPTPEGGGEKYPGRKTPWNPTGEHPIVDIKGRFGGGNPAEGIVNKFAYRQGKRMEDAAGRRSDRKTLIADWAKKNNLPIIADLFKAGAKRTGDREKRLAQTNEKVATEGWQLGDYAKSYFGQGDGSQQIADGTAVQPGQGQGIENNAWYPGKLLQNIVPPKQTVPEAQGQGIEQAGWYPGKNIKKLFGK